MLREDQSSGQEQNRLVVLWLLEGDGEERRLIVKFHNDLFRALDRDGPELTGSQLLRDVHVVEFGGREPIAHSREETHYLVALDPGGNLANTKTEEIAERYARAVAGFIDTYKLVAESKADNSGAVDAALTSEEFDELMAWHPYASRVLALG